MTGFYESIQRRFSQRNSKMVYDEIYEGCFTFWFVTVNNLEVMAESQYRKSLKSVQHRDIMG